MRFRKAMNVSFVLIPIMVFIIGIPLFRFMYTLKDVNNTKKILQEAAYAGALAGTYAIDIANFEVGKEDGRPSTNINNYPYDSETNSPVAFMKQKTGKIRTNATVINADGTTTSKKYYNSKDALGGVDASSVISYNDFAAKEIKAAVDTYMKANFNAVAGGESEYSIAINFERYGLEDKNGNALPTDTSGLGPFNKVTVSVVMNYRPTLLKQSSMKFIFGDKIADDLVIHGTSSAKTKTII